MDFLESVFHDMKAVLHDQGIVSLTVRFVFPESGKAQDIMDAYDKIENVGAWKIQDAPAFVRKALGLKYIHPIETVEPEYLRVCDWYKRGQELEAMEGRR